MPLLNKTKSTDLKSVHLILAGQKAQICCASLLLVDPKALPFGTRLRTFLLKNSLLNCFFNRKNPLSVQVLPSLLNKTKSTDSKSVLLILAGAEGLEPSARGFGVLPSRFCNFKLYGIKYIIIAFLIFLYFMTFNKKWCLFVKINTK